MRDIGVKIETGTAWTGNVSPLLNELRHALRQLLERGEERVIDLRSLPLAPGEESLIETILGSGEVSARINALGISEVRETSVPGIWLVTHRNPENEVLSRFIEVTACPAILRSQDGDMRAGLEQLESMTAERLASRNGRSIQAESDEGSFHER